MNRDGEAYTLFVLESISLLTLPARLTLSSRLTNGWDACDASEEGRTSSKTCLVKDKTRSEEKGQSAHSIDMMNTIELVA